MTAKENLPNIKEWIKQGSLNPDDFREEGGDSPMTDDQVHRLKALAWQLGDSFDPNLTQVEAERRINELQRKL